MDQERLQALKRPSKIVFLSHGTVGDILPMASLAMSLRERVQNTRNTLELYIVSHVLARQAEIQVLVESAGIKLTLLSHDAASSDGSISQEDERQILREEEMDKSYDACRLIQPDYLIFSLFACEGWFIAKSLGIPCLAVSPFLQTRSPPQHFHRELKRQYPELCKWLRESSSGLVSYGEIEAWMWRLYLNDFEAFAGKLQVCSCPYADDVAKGVLSSPTPLLYGVSSVLVDRPPWPPSVHLCGVWSTERFLDISSVRCSSFLPDWEAVSSFVATWDKRLVYLGFGSMEEIGRVEGTSFEDIIKMIADEIRTRDLALLISTSQRNNYNKFVQNCKECLKARVLVSHSLLPHHAIFPHCNIVIHHGGSGTVHAAVKASTPQVIMPLIFDQLFWADRIQWLGLGYSIGHPGKLTPDKLHQAFNLCLSRATSEILHDYAKRINDEDGLSVASDLVRHAFDL